MTDLRVIQAGWDHAAVEDAMFNIVTMTEKANGGWTPVDFFAHGRAEIDAAKARLETLGLGERHRWALDFGCGIGRLTQALASHYVHVDGVDISPEMINLARLYNPYEDVVTYHANDKPDLALFDTGTFDLVYSMIVLQHMPQELQHGYVCEFFRVLAPGGVTVFEIPDGPDYQHKNEWLSMYGVPRATVETWITGAGGRLMDVQSGPDSQWDCVTYTAVTA
jgi:2-polyprenyl-3-methyl-5-hydroxy-6-metoxy-1,4-benzoquinol methylase